MLEKHLDINILSFSKDRTKCFVLFKIKTFLLTDKCCDLQKYMTLQKGFPL